MYVYTFNYMFAISVCIMFADVDLLN